jgi:hypothetical protein
MDGALQDSVSLARATWSALILDGEAVAHGAGTGRLRESSRWRMQQPGDHRRTRHRRDHSMKAPCGSLPGPGAFSIVTSITPRRRSAMGRTTARHCQVGGLWLERSGWAKLAG